MENLDHELPQMVPDYSSEEEDTGVPLRKTRRPKVDKVSISSSFYGRSFFVQKFIQRRENTLV